MNTTHGMTNHPLYQLWKGMHARCGNKNHPAYKNYGGRGITVSTRWSGDRGFANFVADMGERPSLNHCVERRKNDRPYEADNCFWATKKTQNRNKRNNRLVTAFGRTLCLADWAEETGLKYFCILYRLDAGWSPEKALSTPSRKTR